MFGNFKSKNKFASRDNFKIFSKMVDFSINTMIKFENREVPPTLKSKAVLMISLVGPTNSHFFIRSGLVQASNTNDGGLSKCLVVCNFSSVMEVI